MEIIIILHELGLVALCCILTLVSGISLFWPFLGFATWWSWTGALLEPAGPAFDNQISRVTHVWTQLGCELDLNHKSSDFRLGLTWEHFALGLIWDPMYLFLEGMTLVSATFSSAPYVVKLLKLGTSGSPPQLVLWSPDISPRCHLRPLSFLCLISYDAVKLCSRSELIRPGIPLF